MHIPNVHKQAIDPNCPISQDACSKLCEWLQSHPGGTDEVLHHACEGLPPVLPGPLDEVGQVVEQAEGVEGVADDLRYRPGRHEQQHAVLTLHLKPSMEASAHDKHEEDDLEGDEGVGERAGVSLQKEPVDGELLGSI